MREEFFKHFCTLTRLRYRLIWARMRTSNGRIILFFALYLVGASFALLSAVGGLGTAIVANEFSKVDDREILARWTLITIFVNGIGLSLMFGLGTQDAFSEESLRRYPLKAKERFIIRQIIGLLDPIWAFVAAGAIGLAAGFWWFGKGSIILGALAAALFVAASYLATVCLFSFIGRIMRSRAAASTFAIVILALLSFGPLLLSLLVASNAEGVWRLIEPLLLFTPPGAAAKMMAEDGPGTALGSVALLVVWVAALALLLKKIESLRPGNEGNSAGGISPDGFWDGFYDRIAGLFGSQYAPLLSKSLRYHLRCNIIRFSLLTSPLVVMVTQLRASPFGTVIFTFMLFYIIGGATAMAMTLNMFGFDGAGIRRYAILPSSFAPALRAGNLASLLLRGVAVLAAVALWIILERKQFDVRMLPVVLEFAVAGLFLFNALGLWTSVLSPWAANFDAMWNNRLSFGANVVIFCGFLAPLGLGMTLSIILDPSDPSRFWFPGLAAPALSFAFYLFSMRAIEPVLNRRREKLINLIAGARDN
jgi:hypothetical protein